MKFFLDANLPYSTKDVFSRHGEAEHARDAGLGKASDTKIARYARKRKAVLVTQDLEFGNPYLFPTGSHIGLVIVRMPTQFTAAQTRKVLQWFLDVTPSNELLNTVTVVQPGQIRRKEPEEDTILAELEQSHKEFRDGKGKLLRSLKNLR